MEPRTKNKNFIFLLYTLLLLPGAELSLITESFDLLNDLLLPFLSILDASCPIIDLHSANVLFDIILPSVLGSSLWSFGQEFPIKYLLNCSGIWHSLYVLLYTWYVQRLRFILRELSVIFVCNEDSVRAIDTKSCYFPLSSLVISNLRSCTNTTQTG